MFAQCNIEQTIIERYTVLFLIANQLMFIKHMKKFKHSFCVHFLLNNL